MSYLSIAKKVISKETMRIIYGIMLLGLMACAFIMIARADPSENGHTLSSISFQSVTKSADALLTASETTVFADASLGSFTITLPSVSGDSFHGAFFIKKVDTAIDHIVTIQPSNSQLIDGVQSVSLANAGESIMLVADGSGWRALSRRAYDVSGYRAKGSSLGQWYTSPNRGIALTTLRPTASVLYAIPFVTSKRTDIDQMALNVTFARAGTARVGIYEDNGNDYPGNLIIEPTAVTPINTNTTGTLVTTDFMPVTLEPGLYWLTIVVGGTTPTLRAIGVTSMIPVLGFDPTLPTNGQFGWSVSYAYAALPAVFPGGGSSLIGTVPGVFVHIAQ